MNENYNQLSIFRDKKFNESFINGHGKKVYIHTLCLFQRHSLYRRRFKTIYMMY